MNRRKFLRRTSALSVLGLAGCTSDANEPDSGSGGDGTDGSDGGVGAQPDNGTASPTAEPTETPTQTPEDTSSGNSSSGSSGSASDQAWGAGGEMNGINFSFTSRSPECGQGADTADVAFQTEDGQVVVDGTISGSDLCKRAQLASVEYDESADRLKVAIETVQIEECSNDEDEMGAGQCLVDIAYDAQFDFDGELPGEVAVSHDGQGVATAAYGSAGATPADG